MTRSLFVQQCWSPRQMSVVDIPHIPTPSPALTKQQIYCYSKTILEKKQEQRSWRHETQQLIPLSCRCITAVVKEGKCSEEAAYAGTMQCFEGPVGMVRLREALVQSMAKSYQSLTLVSTRGHARPYGVIARAGLPGVSVLWLGATASLILNVYPNVAARELARQIRSWDALCPWLNKLVGWLVA